MPPKRPAHVRLVEEAVVVRDVSERRRGGPDLAGGTLYAATLRVLGDRATEVAPETPSKINGMHAGIVGEALHGQVTTLVVESLANGSQPGGRVGRSTGSVSSRAAIASKAACSVASREACCRTRRRTERKARVAGPA